MAKSSVVFACSNDDADPTIPLVVESDEPNRLQCLQESRKWFNELVKDVQLPDNSNPEMEDKQKRHTSSGLYRRLDAVGQELGAI